MAYLPHASKEHIRPMHTREHEHVVTVTGNAPTLRHCGFCARYTRPADAIYHNSLHTWRRAPDGTHYTICNHATVNYLPAGYYSIYSRASALYSRAQTFAAAIASAR